MAGGMLAAKAGDFAAHPEIAEIFLDRTLHGERQFGDGEFGGVGARFVHAPRGAP